MTVRSEKRILAPIAFLVGVLMAKAVLGDDLAPVPLPPSEAVPEAAYPPAVSGEGPDPCPVAAEASAVDGVVSHVLGKVDPLFDLTASGVIASALIIAALLWLRSAFSTKFAPEPSTETSRLWNLGAALTIGLGLGALSIAPAIPIPGRVLEGGTLVAARLFGGFIAATCAVFGRDFFTRSRGMVLEKQEAKATKLAALTTGQFRVAKAAEIASETPEPKP